MPSEAGAGAVAETLSALARRFLVGFAGEGLQSAFHFAVNLLLIRSLSGFDYGLFAIVFTLGSLALTYVNALVATPSAVSVPRLPAGEDRDAEEAMFDLLAATVALATAALVAAGLVLWGASITVALAGGGFAGAWAARHYLRSTLFALRLPERAATADLVFAGSGALLFVPLLLRVEPDHRLAAALGALALANVAGLAAGLAASGRAWPRWATVRRYGAHWPVVSWSLVGVTTSNVQAQGQTFLLAALAGPAALAPIAAGTVLIAPLRLAVGALISLARPEFVAALGRDDFFRARRLLFAFGACVLLTCLVYGGVLWIGWDLIRRALFDQNFADQPMGLITWLAWLTALAYLSYFLPEALLEAAGRFRAVAGATLVSAVISVTASGLLLMVAAPVWSMLGVILSEILTLWIFWRRASNITRSQPTS